MGALLLLALTVRAIRLDFQPLWWDEGYSVWFANHPLGEMLRLTALDIHPPLYYALLGAWSRLFGLGPVPLRLLSVLVGLLTVAVIYVVGTWLGGRRAGLVAAILLAVNPFHVYYSQEIRMYGLVTLWSVLAVGCSARWLGIAPGKPASDSGSQFAPHHSLIAPAMPLLGYVVAMTLAVYTQYYAAILAISLTLAGLLVLGLQSTRGDRSGSPGIPGRSALKRAAAWLGVQAAVMLLWLPWLLYAAPKLVPYVSQKLVADSDRPLGPVEYLARHLSAYAMGHLEGTLAPLWPLGLLGLLPLAWGLWLLVRSKRQAGSFEPQDPSLKPQDPSLNPQDPSSERQDREAEPQASSSQAPEPYSQPGTSSSQFTIHHSPSSPPTLTILYLLVTLLLLLLIGWLVNLSFPFFPERGERLMLLGLPVFLLLLAVVLTAPSWIPDPDPAMARRRYSSLLAGLVLFAGLALLSLVAFYDTPRYAEEDYRPLIGQVTQWGQPEDTVLSIFPWQVGYFWSYGMPNSPQPVLASENAWGPRVAQDIDTALARGHLWFPEHLSLGGQLETAAEGYLSRQAYNLANRWYSPSTRLTGWTGQLLPLTEAQVSRGGPLDFADGLRLVQAQVRPSTVAAANRAVVVDLLWESATHRPSRHVSLRLTDEQGQTWAQRNYVAANPTDPDRVGLLVPAGTPPGRYDLLLGTSQDPESPLLDVLGPDGRAEGTEARLGSVEVTRPDSPPSIHTLAFEHPLGSSLEDAVELLGFSASGSPMTPGDDLKVNLFWRALPGLAAEDELFALVQLVDGQGQVAAAWEGPPVAWHPTSAWQPGELVRSQHVLRLPATLPDGEYRLIAGLFAPADGRRLTQDGDLLRDATDHVPLTRVQVQGREHRFLAPQPSVALDKSLSRLGRLVGYDLATAQVAPGTSVPLTLYWQATETTGERLTVFVHLLDSNGDFLAQSDGEPAGGAYPTSSWVPGEYLEDAHILAVRPDATPGPARLAIGLYNPNTGQRVPWLADDGQVATDVLILPTTFTVGP